MGKAHSSTKIHARPYFKRNADTKTRGVKASVFWAALRTKPPLLGKANVYADARYRPNVASYHKLMQIPQSLHVHDMFCFDDDFCCMRLHYSKGAAASNRQSAR